MSAQPSNQSLVALAASRPQLYAGDHPANMLIPQAYEIAWTELVQPFNLFLSPGDIAAATGQAAPAPAAGATAPAQAIVTNFPSDRSFTGDRDYENPIAATQVPIGPSSNGFIIGANAKRTLLIIQNNSASGGATFWIAFGQPATQFNSIALTPGQSITLDASCPRDAVSILITGASGLVAGVAIEGSWIASFKQSYSIAGNVGAEAWGYVNTAPAPAPYMGAPAAPAIAAPAPSVPTSPFAAKYIP